VPAQDSYPELPFERPGVLDIPPRYRELQADEPVARVRTLAGDPAWLVTRHSDVRMLFAHPALGRSHPDPERAARFSDTPLLGGPIGDSGTERADHRRMRLALGKAFSSHRAEALRPRVQAILDRLLDDLAELTPPADLHEALSFPLPAHVICDLLGVPFDDHEDFRRWSSGALDMRDPAHAAASIERLHGYMGRLTEEKRRRPGEDVITDMLDADGRGGLTEQEVVQLAAVLLLAGHETTVARIDLGVLLLLSHPDQREMLRQDPSLAPTAVEEILRMSVPGLGLMPRYASADIEIAGVTIPAGDLVLICTGAANRDAEAFSTPDRFDITRAGNPHVAFGYGPRFCLGASLARVELQCVFGTLFRRFPSMELAVPVDRLRRRGHVFTGGLVDLPVAW